MKTLWRITMCLTILLIATPIAGAVPQENVESDSSVQIRSAYCQQVGAGDIVSSNLFIFVSQEAEWPEPLKVVLYDLGSSYGTFLGNGLRVPQGQPAALRTGDEFYLASRGNVFRVEV